MLTHINYDHSSNFDMELLIQHLKALKAGKTALYPIYSYIEHNCTNKMVDVHPSKVITVEGLIFQNPALREMFNIRISRESMPICAFFSAFCRMWGSGGALTVRGHTVPYNGQPHARTVGSALPKIRRHCRAEKRADPSGFGDHHTAHSKSHRLCIKMQG